MSAKQKKVLMVLVPASVILVWRVAALFARLAPSDASATVTEAIVPALAPTPAPLVPLAAPTALASAMLEAQEKRLALPWGRDPFDTSLRPKPTVSAVAPRSAPKPPGWIVTGISRDGDERYAIIGRRVVRVGDKLERKYSVVEVTEDSVTITDGKWQYRYGLGKSTPDFSPAEATP
ncbi:MAG: hypothetical protein U1A27_05940 [Phycisphaerae bacterium]